MKINGYNKLNKISRGFMKIGYFYIKAGNGHYIPAKALYEKTIEQYGKDSAMLVDFYRDCVKDEKIASFTQNMWSKIMLNPSRERFESFLYDNKSIYKHFRSWKFKKNFKAYMDENDFDTIVVTNCVAACIVARLTKLYHPSTKVYYYCSDLIFSYKFVARDRDIDGFIAPTEECVNDLKKKGARNIIQIPIPIQNQIQECIFLSKNEAKEKIGIQKDKFTLLFQVGGEGKGRFKLLELCTKNSLDITFIILGKLSSDTEDALNKLKKNYPSLNILTPGFVTDVQTYVLASDIVMSQSGLNSIAESLYLKTPVLLSLLFYVGRPMSKYIKKHKVGFTETNANSQFNLLKKLVNYPSILDDCTKNIEKLSLNCDTASASKIIVDCCR